MIDILGLGWSNDQSYGQGSSEKPVDYAGRVPIGRLGLEDNLFREPIKNFGRFEPVTQRLCIVTALALRDAGLMSGEEQLDIGILVVNKAGCIASNKRFFHDYIDGGRSLSRANLFIYTLPTGPCAEAAICFNLKGPLLYIDELDDFLNYGIHIVENLLRANQAKAVMINLIEEPNQAAILIGNSTVEKKRLSLSFIPKDIVKPVQLITEKLNKIGQHYEG